MRNIADSSHVTDNEPYFVILESIDDVIRVKESMNDVIRRFGNVTLEDLKNLVGLPTTYFDTKCGWTNIDSVSVQPLKESVRLIFPETNWKLSYS